MKKRGCFRSSTMALLLLFATLTAGCSGMGQVTVPEASDGDAAEPTEEMVSPKPVSVEEAIVGDWETIDGAHRMIFFEDGTVSAGSDGEMSSGTWHMMGELLIITDPYGESQIFDYVEINDNALTLESNGITETFYNNNAELSGDDKAVEDLVAQLLDSAIFAETRDDLFAGATERQEYYAFGDPLDASSEFSYVFLRTYEFPYLKETAADLVSFGYNRNADDFYVLYSQPFEETLSLIGRQEEWEDWQVEGQWTYELDEPSEPYISLVLNITRAEGRTFDISYDYTYRSIVNLPINDRVEISNSGTYTAEEPYIVNEDRELLIDLDGEVSICLERNTGVIFHYLTSYYPMTRS